MLQNAGFADAQMIAQTGFNSTPKTKGTLFRAAKAANFAAEKGKAQGDPLSKYQEFFLRVIDWLPDSCHRATSQTENEPK